MRPTNMRFESPVDRATAAALLERWIPIAGALSLLAANAIDAAVRYMWVDELLSATLISDPSFTHMIRALADQVDTTPPLFYTIAWGWARVFGATALSLRMLSGLFGAGAFLLIWRLVRPYASLPARCVGVCAAMLLPITVLAQVAEARSYGLFLGLAALTLVQVDRAARGRQSWMAISGVLLTQAALSVTHVFGILYSAGALAALIVADRLAKRRPQLALYTAWCVGWLALVAWLPALRWQAQVGSPHFPIAPPTFSDLLNGVLLGTTLRARLIVPVALALVVMVARRSVADDGIELPPPLPTHLVLAAIAWLLATIGIFVLSHVTTPLFLPRYLVPLALTYAVVLPLALDRALVRANAIARRDAIDVTRGPPSRSYLWLMGAIAIVALYAPVWRADSIPRAAPPAGDSLDVHEAIPIATISTHTYLPRVFYAPRPSQYVFVLDWQSALLPNAPVGPTEYKLMAAMKRNYPEHQIEESDAFLAHHSRFLVIDEAGLFWFKRRVRSNPGYKVTMLHSAHLCGTGQPNEVCPLYLVERTDSTSARLASTIRP